MLIPIGLDSSERRIPWVTFGLIVLCCIVFGLQQQATQANLELLEKAMTPYPSLEFMAPDLAQMLGGFEQTYGFPGRLGGWTAFSYIFLHGSTAHLLGNMLILYLLGSKLEDLWGPVTLLLLFLTGGAVAGLFQNFDLSTERQLPSIFTSLNIPPPRQVLIGASGAVAALMGAFTLRLALVRIRFALFYFIVAKPLVFEAPAYLVLIMWLVYQVQIYVSGQSGNVGTLAHIFGFLFGLGVAWFLIKTQLERVTYSPQHRQEETLKSVDQALKLLQENKAAQAKSLLLEHLKTHPQDPRAWEGLALAKEKLGEDASVEWRKTILTLQKTEPLKGAVLLSRHPEAMDMSLALSLHTRLHSRDGAKMLTKAAQDYPQDALLPKLLHTLLTHYPGPISQHFVNSQLEGVQDPEWQRRLSGLLEGRA